MTHYTVISFLLLLCLVFIPSREIPARDITAADLIYITEDYRPYSYEENDKLKGIAVDLLKLMWREMGYPNQPVRLYPWARGYNTILTTPNSVLFAMSRTQARENQFKWVCSINMNRHVLISRKDRNIKINTLDDAKRYTIGMVRDDASGQLLVNAGFDPNRLHKVSRLIQNIKMLNVNRIDMFAYGEKTARDVIKNNGLRIEEYETVFVISEEKACYAFHIDTPDQLIHQFQKALDAITITPAYQILLDQYFK